ncbi:MAG: hypothetical protein HRT61_16465 [Ekhidna sp.]|nr:hypothetical protein [Ekhidna sp.]
MAEEIDIKTLWKKSKEKSDFSQVQQRFAEKAKRSSLEWIRIILTVEFWLTILFAPFTIYSLAQMGYSFWVYGFCGLFCIGYLFYYQFLIRQIRSFQYHKDVLNNLQKIYNYLRFYLLHYKVLIWIALIAGFIAGLFAEENKEDLAILSTTKEWVIVIAISSALLVAVGLLFHLLIYLVYGRKVKRIKHTLDDLRRGE